MTNLWCHPGLLSSSRRRGSIHFAFALFLAFFFVACSDDDSDFATKASGDSSSSVKSSSSAKSSGSEDKKNQCNVETDKNCIKDDRDGQTYRIVKIGDQVWMAENLNYAYTDVPYDFGFNRSDSTSWCYDNAAKNCSDYGRLYTWAAAMDSVGTWSSSGKGCGYGSTCSPTDPVRGICPEGWHLPSKAEWETLAAAVGGISTACTKLKSTSGWYESGNGTDEFGFTAIPAGSRSHEFGKFQAKGKELHFWTSIEYAEKMRTRFTWAMLMSMCIRIFTIKISGSPSVA